MMIMRHPVDSSSFRRDVARMKKRNKDMTKLRELVLLLASGTPLPPKYKDHALLGKLSGYRGCHLEFDWVLIYKIQDTDLVLYRTGTHGDVFE